MQKDVMEGKLRRSSLEKFLTDGADIADLVFRSAHRAAELDQQLQAGGGGPDL